VCAVTRCDDAKTEWPDDDHSTRIVFIGRDLPQAFVEALKQRGTASIFTSTAARRA